MGGVFGQFVPFDFVSFISFFERDSFIVATKDVTSDGAAFDVGDFYVFSRKVER